MEETESETAFAEEAETETSIMEETESAFVRETESIGQSETEMFLTEESQTEPAVTDVQQAMSETDPIAEGVIAETPDSEDTAFSQDDIIGESEIIETSESDTGELPQTELSPETDAGESLPDESSDALIEDGMADGSQTQMSEDVSDKTPEAARELLDAFGKAISESIGLY